MNMRWPPAQRAGGSSGDRSGKGLWRVAWSRSVAGQQSRRLARARDGQGRLMPGLPRDDGPAGQDRIQQARLPVRQVGLDDERPGSSQNHGIRGMNGGRATSFGQDRRGLNERSNERRHEPEAHVTQHLPPRDPIPQRPFPAVFPNSHSRRNRIPLHPSPYGKAARQSPAVRGRGAGRCVDPQCFVPSAPYWCRRETPVGPMADSQTAGPLPCHARRAGPVAAAHRAIAERAEGRAGLLGHAAGPGLGCKPTTCRLTPRAECTLTLRPLKCRAAGGVRLYLARQAAGNPIRSRKTS